MLSCMGCTEWTGERGRGEGGGEWESWERIVAIVIIGNEQNEEEEDVAKGEAQKNFLKYS